MPKPVCDIDIPFCRPSWATADRVQQSKIAQTPRQVFEGPLMFGECNREHLRPCSYFLAVAAKSSINFTHWATSLTSCGDRYSYSTVITPRHFHSWNCLSSAPILPSPVPSGTSRLSLLPDSAASFR